jgi:dynactin complex subunit
MMRPAAGFHCNNTRGQFANKFDNSITTKPSAQNDRAGLVEPNEAAHVLAKINSKHKY